MLFDVVEDVQDMMGQGGPVVLKDGAEVSSLQMAFDGTSPNGLMQSMSVRASPGSERKLMRAVSALVAEAKQDENILTALVTQSPQDPCDFMVLLRYGSMQKMNEHQSGKRFKELLDGLEEHLDRPIGLYLTDESMGQLGQTRFPFGPGGEGGRDDAIYSSRKS